MTDLMLRSVDEGSFHPRYEAHAAAADRFPNLD